MSGIKSQKPLKVSENRRFQGKSCKVLKPAYYRIYDIDSEVYATIDTTEQAYSLWMVQTRVQQI